MLAILAQGSPGPQPRLNQSGRTCSDRVCCTAVLGPYIALAVVAVAFYVRSGIYAACLSRLACLSYQTPSVGATRCS
eukprot:387695-Alexandrium_andersonii.AAC.1